VKGIEETTEATELYSLGRIFLIRATTDKLNHQLKKFTYVRVVFLT
jgi:hypothetical protein